MEVIIKRTDDGTVYVNGKPVANAEEWVRVTLSVTNNMYVDVNGKQVYQEGNYGRGYVEVDNG